MQENKIPLISYIGKITGKEIVVKDDRYIFLKSFLPVGADVLEEALKLKNREDIDSDIKKLEESLLISFDKKAKELGFTGDTNTRPYRAIANYVGFPNEYRADAEKLGVWFARCFKKADEIRRAVASGERKLPTVEELLGEMPQWIN